MTHHLQPMRTLLIGVVASAMATTSFAQSPTTYARDDITARLADLHKIHTPEGIEVVEPVQVNGSTQWISIRGLNKANPVLLVLHGGPGSALMGATWAYQKPWEDFFTVVNWDQRGVGKSFSAADSGSLGPTMSTGQQVLDGEVIVQHVLKRLGKDKLFLMGYSFGTVFGPYMALRHPEWYHAWVGIGVSAGSSDESYLYERVRQLARAASDSVGMRELDSLAPYPAPGPFDVKKALAVRKWVRRYNGGWYGKPDFDLYFALPQWGPEYTADNARDLTTAIQWSERHIMNKPEPDFMKVEPMNFTVPVVFLMGRYDLHTPYKTALEYFNKLKAPRKRFVSFERSSHMIMFEEPGRVLMTLVRDVLPLAPRTPPFAPSEAR